MSEKGALPKINFVRGFEVIDEIKSALVKECPKTVFCVVILSIASRDLMVLVLYTRNCHKIFNRTSKKKIK